MRDGKFTALIAVRDGSNRVLRKNIRDFAGSSLLKIKIEQALAVDGIDEVVVSSDSDEMLNLATSLKVNAMKRLPEFCTDSIEMKKVYKHLAENIDTDHVIYLHVTSPLLKCETLQKGIEIYRNMPEEYSSLASVEHIMKYIWFEEKAINYDPKNHPRSQDLDKYYVLNFAINIIPREDMIMTESILGNKFYPYFISEIESLDVDTKLQFDLAEYMYKKINQKINN